MNQTPDTDRILAALAEAGITVTDTQIEADSIDIHLDHTYAGWSTDYRAVSLSWRPGRWAGQLVDGQWYLMPLDPEDEGAPTPRPDYLAGDGTDPAEVVREVVEMLAESDERRAGAPVGPTPEQIPPVVQRIADDMSGDGDSPYAYAIGYIRSGVDGGLSDAEFRALVRTVLAAVDLAQGGA